MKGFGWRHDFIEQEWANVRLRLEQVNWLDDEADYLFDIIDSVLSSDADDTLAVTTSMHDLVITTKPVGSPPHDVVVVCAPRSPRSHPPGSIRIDHVAVSGRNTEIVRPTAEALSLFWRFLDVEFGIRRAT